MKDYNETAQKTKLVQEYLKARKIDKFEKGNVTVGNNGYQVGQEFTLKGNIRLVEDKTTGIPTYFGLDTEEGAVLSLKSLMGISSDRGYTLNGRIDCERYVLDSKGKATDRTETYPVECQTTEDYKFEDVWQPPTRNLCELAAAICNNPKLLEDKKVTFLGTIGRQITVRKQSPSNFTEKYPAGAKRVITARVWHIADANEIDWDKIK